MLMLRFSFLLLSTLSTGVLSFAPAPAVAPRSTKQSAAATPNNNNHDIEIDTTDQSGRREALRKLTRGSLFGGAATLAAPPPVLAGGGKSRTQGYAVQRTEAEWSTLLSPAQYFVLRTGGTEAPYASILEGEDRPGTHACAGCGAPLFDAAAKFHSGTGWPSYAAPVTRAAPDGAAPVSNVEMEGVSQFQFQLAGAEVRCRNCGGHLGDVFADGFLFPGTPAYATGKRYCIDGAALVFVPQAQKGAEGGGELELVSGDLPPRNKGGRGAAVFPG